MLVSIDVAKLCGFGDRVLAEILMQIAIDLFRENSKITTTSGTRQTAAVSLFQSLWRCTNRAVRFSIPPGQAYTASASRYTRVDRNDGSVHRGGLIRNHVGDHLGHTDRVGHRAKPAVSSHQ